MLRAGIDLGGTKIQVAIVDQDDQVLGTDRRPTPTTGTPGGVTDAIASSVKAAITAASVDLADIVGVGIGGPGQIDVEAGTLSNAGNLPGWMITYPLVAELSRRLGGIPVFLGNDVQVGVNAEVALGAGREYDSLIGVFCGTGIGGGIIINDELWVGRGSAGEIGHMQIMAKDGALCGCGRHGCLEAYAGRAAMEEQARLWVRKGRRTKLFKIMKKKDKPRLASGVWASALKKNDKMAHKLIDRAIWALGSGIGSSVNLVDPEAIIIGGGLGIRLGQPFVDAIRVAMIPHLLKPDTPPAVLLAELGDLGGALGAALLVQNVDVDATSVRHGAAAKKTADASANKDAAPSKKAAAKKAPAKKAPAAKKAAAKKAPAKKAPAAKKAAAKKAPAKKAPAAKKAAAKKAPAKKVPAAKKAPAASRATTSKGSTAKKSG
jgi:glucokinase